jgi:hypothetical protein
MWIAAAALLGFFLLTRPQHVDHGGSYRTGIVGQSDIGTPIPAPTPPLLSTEPVLRPVRLAPSLPAAAAAGGGTSAAELIPLAAKIPSLVSSIGGAGAAGISGLTAAAIPFAFVGAGAAILNAFGIGHGDPVANANARSWGAAYNSYLTAHGVDPNQVQLGDPSGTIQAAAHDYANATVPAAVIMPAVSAPAASPAAAAFIAPPATAGIGGAGGHEN